MLYKDEDKRLVVTHQEGKFGNYVPIGYTQSIEEGIVGIVQSASDGIDARLVPEGMSGIRASGEDEKRLRRERTDR